jgi:tetratricopeptide (TPR) repeat protein
MQWCHQYKGDFDQVLLLKERSLDAMGDRFYLPNYSWALVAAAGAYTGLGYWDKAQEECFQLMEVAEKFSDNSIIASAANGLCYAYIYQKDSAKAIKYGELAVKKAITPGDKIWAECLLASVWCRTGEIQKGIEYLSNAIPLIRAVQFLPCGFFSMFLGEGYFLNGEYEKAKKVFEEYLQIIDGRDMKWETGIVHYFLGEIAMKTEPKRAPNHFDTSIAQFKKIKAKNDLALAYAGYGRYHKHIGEMAKAYEYLTQALDIFERLGTLIEPEKVKAELDELPKT